MKCADHFPLANGLENFFQTDLRSAEQYLRQSDPDLLIEEGRQMTFDLFHAMAEKVPAYRDFLLKHQFDSARVQTLEDIKQIPVMDKENYLRAYPLDQLCWDGKLQASSVSSSSGSSGKPTFWPRSEQIETETTYLFEFFLKNQFQVQKESTLFISCFAMGIYVGGSFTLNCCTRINQKGYPLTIVTPGISKADTISCFLNLADYYDHIILGGYPPLLKDILDELEDSGVSLAAHKISFQFAAESISEEFRRYMYQRIHVPENEYVSRSMNLYGTADAAVAGHETRMSIFLRKLLAEHPETCRELFGTITVPSVNCYYPFFKSFESVDDELVFSSKNNAIPLCRYNIHDAGGLISFQEQEELFARFGYSLEDVEKVVGKQHLWKLPLLYLHGKSDNAVSLYGLLIYAETIKQALENKDLEEKITGKFVMKTALNSQQDQYLHIYVETRPGISIQNDTLTQLAREEIIHVLKRTNAEYATLYQSDPARCQPTIELCPYEDAYYFPSDIKHRWVKK